MINEINGINASDTWHDAIAVFTEVPASSTEATRPNIFRIAGFPRRETVSSNVLAYFFDPAEGHGLKDLSSRLCCGQFTRKTWMSAMSACPRKRLQARIIA